MEYYLVGGAVRDKIMGLPNEDFDYVVVGSDSQSMENLGFSQVGKDFPVFLDPQSGDQFALARREKKIAAGYQGFSVEFDKSVTLEEDCKRRDLTMNSMAIDSRGELIDYYGGQNDIKNKILRHVSPAFMEDPLRVIRLARFYARFSDFTIAPETIQLAKGVVQSGEMEHISVERYWQEIFKTFAQSKKPSRFFQALQDFGVFKHVSFFTDMFGDFQMDTTSRIHIDCMSNIITDKSLNELIATVSIAVTLKDKPTHRKTPTRIIELAEIYQNYCKSEKRITPKYMLDVFKKCKALNQETQTLIDVVYMISFIEGVNRQRLAFSTSQFEIAYNACKTVTSAPYQHLEGKQIGVAMENERLIKISQALGV